MHQQASVGILGELVLELRTLGRVVLEERLHKLVDFVVDEANHLQSSVKRTLSRELQRGLTRPGHGDDV